MPGSSARIEQWLFPGMRVADLLRARPAALAVLEAFGIDPFARWSASLESLGPDWRALEAALETLAPAGRDREGPPGRGDGGEARREPDADATMPDLLDRLVREHAGFLEGDLPSIGEALALSATRGIASRRLDYLAREWTGFSEGLIAHIREEESFLFPRLLHYDYCVRRRGCHPDFTGGSVSVFVAIRLLGNERAQTAALARFLEGWRSPDLEEPAADAALERLHGLLARFLDDLLQHHALEERELFPRARALERALLDAAISGRADR